MLATVFAGDAYAIFDRARTYWDAASYPPSLSYGIVVTVKRNSVTSSAHYHAYYRTPGDQVVLNAVSDEESAHPYTPKGMKTEINLSLYGAPLRSIPLSAPENTFDYLGVPMLTPNYSFGIAHAVPHVKTATDVNLTSQNGLKTIASLQVTHRHYAISLAGIVPVGEHEDYHLLLRPIDDPSKYRLRAAFIDMRTFATDRIVTNGDFVASQLAEIPWSITFQWIDDAPYVASEQALSGFVLDRRRYDSALIRFSNPVAAPIPQYADLSSFATAAGTAPEILKEPDGP